MDSAAPAGARPPDAGRWTTARRTTDRGSSRSAPTSGHDTVGRAMSGTNGFPERIVCLTEETTETLYLLGEDWRIVGISGFTVRPPQARKEKPKVSAFTSAKIDRIV